MFLAVSPWTYLRDVKIDMGYTATTASDIFRLLQIGLICASTLLVMASVIGYISARKGQEAAAHKNAALQRAGMLLMSGSAIAVLSLIMEIFNYFFGV